MIMISAGQTTTAIYAICIDGKVVYVGKSRDLYSRAKQHKTSILHSNNQWYPLAREFHERGHLLTMRVLATPEYKDLDKAEKEFIDKVKPLFNYQNNENKYESIDYEYAVNKLFLGYRPPIKKKKETQQKNWFGEEIKFRKW